jgi:hypothetical protein
MNESESGVPDTMAAENQEVEVAELLELIPPESRVGGQLVEKEPSTPCTPRSS